jgi:flagellar basal body rod protein FlgG
MYISAQGAQAQSKRMEVIANNMANVDTVGFKRDLAIQRARYSEEIERGDLSPGTGAIQDIGGGMEFNATATDFSAGPQRHTGIPSDVAIQNDGFFQVRKGNDILLTRAGNFRLTGNGELVTQQGYPVLDANNAPITITPENGPWSIDSSGAVTQGSTKQQDLAIVQPVNSQGAQALGNMVKVGENLYRPMGQVKPVAAGARVVNGGYVEMSSVEPTREITSMIETSRMLEANLNILKTHNEMLDNLISRVLKA